MADIYEQNTQTCTRKQKFANPERPTNKCRRHLPGAKCKHHIHSIRGSHQKHNFWGADFINDAGVYSNFTQCTWCFADKPQDTIPLEQEIMATKFNGANRISDFGAEENSRQVSSSEKRTRRCSRQPLHQGGETIADSARIAPPSRKMSANKKDKTDATMPFTKLSNAASCGRDCASLHWEGLTSPIPATHAQDRAGKVAYIKRCT